MRQRRTLLGMSQSKVGEAVGLTFQQIQKYERGSNRIGSSRLYEFAKVLDVPVSYFFDEMPSNALSGRPMSGRGRKGFGEAGTPFEQEKDPLIKRETLELVRAYYKIREGRVRKRIFEMVKAVGAASHAEVLGGRKQRKTHPGELSRRIALLGRLLCSRWLSPLHRRAPLRPLPTATRSSRAASPIAYGASTLPRPNRSALMDGRRAAWPRPGCRH